MKRLSIPLLLITAVAFPGCLMELLATTAITGELNRQGAGSAVNALEYAQNSTSKMNVDHAIGLYRAEKGANPPSLEALVPDYLAAVPLRADGQPYAYDPVSGQLLDRPGMPLPAQPAVESNEQRMARIREAINRYGYSARYYPPSLQALVPTYLPAVPTTTDGRAFVYYPQNGALAHPDQLTGTYTPDAPAAAAAQPYAQPVRGGTAVGGAGPLGETLTGIGIQQQLNGMSSAAGGDVGNRATRDARGIGQSHTDRQTQAMDDLGL